MNGLTLSAHQVKLKIPCLEAWKRCQVCCWLFRSFATLRALLASLFSVSILPLIDKQAELADEYFSNLIVGVHQTVRVAL